LNNSLKPWLGRVTTGHGVAVLASALLAVMSGTTTWAAAAPFLLAGVIGLIWPEAAPLLTPALPVPGHVTDVVTTHNGVTTIPEPEPKLAARKRPAR
jgi:hypothetical protein